MEIIINRIIKKRSIPNFQKFESQIGAGVVFNIVEAGGSQYVTESVIKFST